MYKLFILLLAKYTSIMKIKFRRPELWGGKSSRSNGVNSSLQVQVSDRKQAKRKTLSSIVKTLVKVHCTLSTAYF